MKRFSAVHALCTAVLLSGPVSAGAADFARDVQPVLAKHCYECHGPEQQKGKLRLDVRESALKTPIIAKGQPEQSELIRRIRLPKGHDDVMPPRGEPLKSAEVQILAEWIRRGAHWPEGVAAATHWAYVKPVRPAIPAMNNARWPKNPIDAFILARLEREKLRPSREADRATLLRRVYLDLIGLPPSPTEVDAFLNDRSPDAYERVVDRLLHLPQYGERWARPWLDLGRYADSSGYQRDNLWDLWPYRDWVIGALNRDLPFDRFTIEQIAGDLLPGATVEQKVATGFNRSVPTNVEAGADQEETRVTQVFDRVNTLGAVWLGTTLECAQCHNHKYDPFSQKEYYRLFAFFNNTSIETDRRNPNATAALKFAGPYLSLPDAAIEQKRGELQRAIADIKLRMEHRSNTLASAQASWEEQLRQEALDSGAVHLLDIADFDTESGSLYRLLEDKSVLLIKNDNEAVPTRDVYTVTVSTRLSGITGFKLEALADPSLPGNGPGRGDPRAPNFVLNSFSVTIAPAGRPSAAEPVKLRNARASFSQQNYAVAGAIDGNPRSGWAIRPEFSRDHWAVFETAHPVGNADGAVLTFKLEQNNGSGRTIGRLRLWAVTGAVSTNTIPADILPILSQPASGRTRAQQARLTAFYLSRDSAISEWQSERARLQGELKELRPPQTLVMQELPQPRMSSVFVRGSFLEPGEPVQPGTPAVLHPLPEGPPNRLTLARWLVDTNNPLVARVTVNRWWMEFFGRGLVTTPEDFGIKGEPPTHPELLDWLAVEFIENGWSMKKLHRLIVTSATYRQSSAVTPELLEKDDQNKLYARGPRFRLDAEMIRDNALAVAGLLSLKQGGPPIRPYQPPGIWENKVGGDNITYEISEGEDRYRRGIYIVWKRTSPYPSFMNFDATERTACVVKRSRSNTPLQALTLLNDPVYVEAAAGLARRLLAETGTASAAEKIRHAFLLCVARKPTSRESAVLERLYREQLAASRADPESARRLLEPLGIPDGLDAAEFAAWHAVAWALLNLNETITKG